MKRIRLLIVAVALAFVGMVAVPTAAHASVNGSAAGPYVIGTTLSGSDTCAAISGSYNNVVYMRVDACIGGLGIVGHEEISGGGYTPINGSEYYRSDGNCTPWFYGYSGTVNPGPYKFTTWWDVSSTETVKLATVTLTVDA